MHPLFTIARLNLTTTGWTDVVCPFACSVVKLVNEDNAHTQDLRSDKGDSTTQMALLPSGERVIDSPVTAFDVGRVVCSLRAQSGAGPVVAMFIR